MTVKCFNDQMCYIQVKEQDPMRIITTLDQCMRSLPKEKLHDVICIGASGQMHGVLFWKSNTGETNNTTLKPGFSKWGPVVFNIYLLIYFIFI